MVTDERERARKFAEENTFASHADESWLKPMSIEVMREALEKLRIPEGEDRAARRARAICEALMNGAPVDESKYIGERHLVLHGGTVFCPPGKRETVEMLRAELRALPLAELTKEGE